MHCSTKLTPFCLVLSQHPTRPTTFEVPTKFPPDNKAVTYPHALQALIIHRIASMRKDADKGMKVARRRNHEDEN